MNGIHEVVGSIPVASIDRIMSGSEVPNLDALLGDVPSDEESALETPREGFVVPERFEEDPKPFFRDKEYYRKVLDGEGEEAKRLHENITAMLKAQASDDRSRYRERVVAAFWNLGSNVASKIGDGLSIPKVLLLRYGIVSPTFLSKEQRDLITRIIFDNNTGEPVHYLDEWLLKIARGVEKPSATDEAKVVKQDADQKVLETFEKRKGKKDSELMLLRNRVSQLNDLEAELLAQVQLLTQREMREEYGGLKDSYTDAQRQALTTMSTVLRRLSTVNRDVKQSYTTLEGLDADLEALAREAEGVGGSAGVDKTAIVDEYNTIRQMVKMCVGRRGNHYPVLTQQYARSTLDGIATRENVLKEMAAVETLDQGLFMRTFKGQTNRIVPNVLLVASYGDSGMCWEPFEKYNRATSRGRIAVPLYPKNVKVAVVTALAELRWLVAKEKAQHYWMEEGLTGWYYQWFDSTKQKGDVKDAFVRDYQLWINAESQGMQKLDREVRGIFWRNLPFPTEVKEDLKNRGFVYADLYKKDQNISKSDGY